MQFDPSLPLTWISNRDFDFAEGSFGHHEGERWGSERVVGFVHTRRILFVKPTYFIVLDTVTAPAGDTAEHTCEAVFHLDARDARVDAVTSTIRTADPGRAGITILPLSTSDLSVRMVKGQTDPEMQGWISDDAFGQRAVPTAMITRKTSGTVHLVYVFAPAASRQSCPVTGLSAEPSDDQSAVSAMIRMKDGGSDRLALTNDGIVRLRRSNGRHFSSAKQ